MHIEFVRLSRQDSTPIFKVWDRNACSFEEHNEHDAWTTWADFLEDLKESLQSKGIEFGGRYHEKGDDLLQKYESAAPLYLKNLGQPAPPPPSRARTLMGAIGVWIALLAIATFLLYVVWLQVIRPSLGMLGWIDYQTTAQERYERFLAEATACKDSKKVISEKNLRVPALHIFVCADGQEKVWAYGLEKVTKSATGKWILE